MGWLSVTPDGSQEPRYKYMAGIDLPELPADEDTQDLWTSAGMYSVSADGSQFPLTWLEIDAFARLSQGGQHAIVWQTIRDMSIAYVSAIRDTHPLSIPPAYRGK